MSRAQTEWQVCNQSAVTVERLSIPLTSDYVMKRVGDSPTKSLHQDRTSYTHEVELDKIYWISSAARKQKKMEWFSVVQGSFTVDLYPHTREYNILILVNIYSHTILVLV